MKLKRGKIGWDDFVIGLDPPTNQPVPFLNSSPIITKSDIARP